MARNPRMFQDGGYYHVVNRGNNRKATCFDEADYLQFLRFLSISCDRYKVKAVAVCLMPNHYHALFTPTISEELSACIAHFSSIYAKYFNKKYEIDGHLWQRRYWSGHVGEGGHLARVWRYIEQNPVRAGMVLTPDQWEWSSAAFRSTGHRPHYLMEPDWWGTAVMKQWWKNEMLTSSELAEIRNSYIMPGTTVSLGDTVVPGTIQCPNGTSTDRRDIERSTTRESGRFD
ncbi:MAG: transposase [Phycisphaerales bacterium]|nr:transposase [Phycisphaerales bacterium]